MRFRLASLMGSGLVLGLAVPLALQDVVRPRPIALGSTVRAPMPKTTAEAWLVPDEDERAGIASAAVRDLTLGVERLAEGRAPAALGLIDAAALDGTPLGGYAHYYRALAWLELGRVEEARAALREAHHAARPGGHLEAAILVAAGDAAMAAEDYVAAVAFYEQRYGHSASGRDAVLNKWAQALERAGRRDEAFAAWLRLYYEYPTSDHAGGAKARAEALGPPAAAEEPDVGTRLARELDRAERLLEARRYKAAAEAFTALRALTTGDARELVDLRIGTASYHLKQYQRALDTTGPLTSRGGHQADARLIHALALKGLNRRAEYVRDVRELARRFPESGAAEDGLNDLATHYILASQRDEAMAVFRDLYAMHPTGRHAERAASRYGWWRYRERDYAEAARVFEQAAADFSRANNRPAWLYWSGRAREALGQAETAVARYELVAVDYLNSYYGQLAARRLRARGLTPGQLTVASAAPMWVDARAAAPPTPAPAGQETRVRWLLAAGLHQDALDELHEIQRTHGSTPVIEATIAWVRLQRGQKLAAVALMRRAYAHYIAAGGDDLPDEIRRLVFPFDYWDIVQKYAGAHGLDPYLVAALISQESSFDPTARSTANAYGLMQILPPTGRALARRLGVHPFSTSRLTEPYLNIRLGTRYLKDLMEQYRGEAHLALAAYNAGGRPVARWVAERRGDGLDVEEFIDDIPYPETQLYVKRVLGLRDVYRRIYGGGDASAE